MLLKNQFAAFCVTHKNQPGFEAKLCQTFSTNLLKDDAKPPLIWLEANACSEDSISMLNTVDPQLRQVLCSLLEIRYWNALMPDQGELALSNLLQTAEQPGFF
jgi:hydrogenase small subunit